MCSSDLADHAGGAARLRDALGLTVHAALEVAAILEAGDEAKASVPVGRAQGTYAPDYVYRAVDRVERTTDADGVATVLGGGASDALERP